MGDPPQVLSEDLVEEEVVPKTMELLAVAEDIPEGGVVHTRTKPVGVEARTVVVRDAKVLVEETARTTDL